MPSQTKKSARVFEQMAESMIVPILGKGAPYLTHSLEWTMPHGERGNVSLHLFRDSFKPGRVYRSSWLACRWNWDGMTAPDGYTLPRSDVPGGWPSVFTYPSGKANFHPFAYRDVEQLRRNLVQHLDQLTAPDTPEREAFGAIEFQLKEEV